MKTAIRILTTLLFISVSFGHVKGQTQTEYLNKVWSKFNLGGSLGSRNIFVRDFDGNGQKEILLSAYKDYGGSYFAIMSFIDNEYIPSWSSPFYTSNNIRVVQTANFDGDNDFEIYILTINGDIEVYDGETMELENTFSTGSSYASQAIFADLDEDGNFEFIVVADNWDEEYMSVYDAQTFELEYQSMDIAATDLVVGDVDGDGINEIILSTGYVVNALDFSIEWEYIGEFGSWVDLADVNEDLVPEIIGANYSGTVTAFDCILHSPIWQFSTGYSGNEALMVTDLEGDGVSEILLGVENYSVSIVCYNASTQELLWENMDSNAGITEIGIGDPDNDGVDEFIWGSGVGSSGSDHLHVGSLETYLTEWKSEALEGNFCVNVEDVNVDDTLEIIVTTEVDDYSNGGGLFIEYNGETHKLIDRFFAEYSQDITCIATANINNTPTAEIVAGISNKVYVYDAITSQILWKSASLGYITDIELADIDNDGIIEIVVGDSWGYITIFDGQTYEEEWKSIQTGNQISDVEIENCDTDDALEIVFCNYEGIIQMYDGITHSLEWQSTNIDNVTALDIYDYNQDGIMDIISGDEYGDVKFIRCSDFSIIETLESFNDEIRGILVDNIDSTNMPEIIVGSESLKVFDQESMELIWEIEDYGQYCGSYDNIAVTDTDNDQFKEVLFSTNWGVFLFEANSRTPDTKPPKIVRELPPEGMTSVGTNNIIEVMFSELIDESTLITDNIEVSAEDGTPLTFSIIYDNNSNKLTLETESYFPTENEILVLFSASIADTAGNGLDGNKNGIAEGSPIDDFAWSFTTGLGSDEIGPVFTDLFSDSDEKWEGVKFNISGVVSDQSDYAQSLIATAECFIDEIGDYGEGIPISADDWYFDEIEEEVYINLETNNLTEGEHTIYFHAKDVVGNWGDFSELVISIIVEWPGNWTMFGNNPQHTGHNDLDSIQLPLKLLWTKSFPAEDIHPVCIVNDKLLVSTDHWNWATDKGIYMLSEESGDIEWFHFYNGIYSVNPPSFAYGNAYIQLCDGSDSFVKAFNIETGDEVWSTPYEVQFDRTLAPTIANGKVYVSGGYQGGVYSFDAFDGKECWHNDLPSFDDWTPTYYNNTVYTFTDSEDSNNGYLTAIDTQFGSFVWDNDDISYQWHSTLGSAPVVDTLSRIIITTSKQFLTAIDIDSHEIIWEKTGIFVNPALQNSILYCINEGALYAYDIYTGDELWSFSKITPFTFVPVISNGYIFVSTDGHFYAINIANHTEEWDYPVGGHITVGDDHLYVADQLGYLYAFGELQVGDVEHQIQTDDIVLYQNYPNPVSKHENTTIKYYIPQNANVRLKVFDVHGVEVLNLINAFKMSGEHNTSFNTANLSSGVYFYKLEVGTRHSIVKKLVVGRN